MCITTIYTASAIYFNTVHQINSNTEEIKEIQTKVDNYDIEIKNLEIKEAIKAETLNGINTQLSDIKNELDMYVFNKGTRTYSAK